jgi:hypothetical protein
MRIPATAVAAVVAVLAGLALVVAGARSDTPRFETRTTQSAAPRPTTVPVASVPVQPSPSAVPTPRNGLLLDVGYPYVALVALLLVVFVVLVFPHFRRPSLSRRGRNRRDRPVADPDAVEVGSGREALAEAVDDGLRDVEHGQPRDAVVACWVRLEDAAARAGTARRPAETAAELTARVLAAHRVAPDTLRRLADLYREARFSRHAMDERARDEARAALESIRRELGAGRGEPVGPA